MSKSLDPDKDRHCVGPDLGPNCLQSLSADNKSRVGKERVMQSWSKNNIYLSSILSHDEFQNSQTSTTDTTFRTHSSFLFHRHWNKKIFKITKYSYSLLDS